MSSLRNNYDRLTPGSKTAFSLFLTDDGTGDFTANENLDADGSVTPLKFWLQPKPEEIMVLSHVAVTLSDTGTPTNSDYGGVPGPLANGTVFFIERNGQERFIGRTLNENDDYIPISRTFDIVGFVSVRVLVYRDILSEYSNGLRLDGSKNEKFGLYIRDDLSTLTEHNCFVKGYIQKKVV